MVLTISDASIELGQVFKEFECNEVMTERNGRGISVH